MPVPESKITGWLSHKTITQLVFPPYRRWSTPGQGKLPRTPQNETSNAQNLLFGNAYLQVSGYNAEKDNTVHFFMDVLLVLDKDI